MKLLPPRRTFCVHHTTMYQFTVCHFIRSHIRRLHVCLTVTCHLHFWQNNRDLLRASAVTGVATDTKIEVCTESLLRRRKVPRRWPGNESVIFRQRVRHSTTELSPLLQTWFVPCSRCGCVDWKLAMQWRTHCRITSHAAVFSSNACSTSSCPVLLCVSVA